MCERCFAETDTIEYRFNVQRFCGDFRVKKKVLNFAFLIFSFPIFSLDAMGPYNTGRSMDRNGRKEEAKVQYNKAIQVCLEEIETAKNDDRKLDAYSICTWSLINLGQYAEVLKYSNDALKIRRDHRIIEVLGEAYFYLGKYGRALAHFQEYVNMQGVYRLGIAYFFIGEMYARQGKHSKAEFAYSMAVRHTDYRDNPNIATWWYNLARERELLMDKERAQDRRSVIDSYWQVLRFSPKYPGVQEKIQEIQKL